VGREQERGEIAELLAQQRVVTLTGTGGCGKTRLALAVADDVKARFRDGVLWVELAGVRDPLMVASAVSGAIGVSEGRPLGLTDALTERLGDQRVLLVVDNCEHVLEACATLVADLLAGCPRLCLLATSREALMIEGETAHEVPPLAVPDRDALSANEVRQASAAQLFELRAQQVRPDFALSDENAAAVGSVCRHLDGIPLAVELAAARVRVLAPAQIAAGLADRFRLLTGGYRTAPPRQQTLEASVAWSYGLLADPERLVLARLSVFAGTFDLEAAQTVVTGPDVEERDVLELVTALADRSLLQVDDQGGRARYRLLETIRLFAQERLAELDDPARVRDRHLDHFVELAGRARAGLSFEAGSWTDLLTADLDDLRAAMAWGVDSGRQAAVVDITEPTRMFWLDRGRYAEMERWLDAAVDTPAATDADRARGLTTATVVMLGAGRHGRAHDLADRAVHVSRLIEAEDTLALSVALRAFAGVYSGRASTSAIASDLDEAAGLAAQVEDDPTRGLALIFVGLAQCYGGRLNAAKGLLESAVETCERAGVSSSLPAAHAFLGIPLLLAGDLDRARAHERAALEWTRQVDRPGYEVTARVVLATADALSGNTGAARQQFTEAGKLLRARNLIPSSFELFLGRWSAFAALQSGEVREARRAGEALVESAHEREAGLYEASAELVLGFSALAEQQLDDAHQHLERCQQLSVEPRVPFSLGRALVGLACLDDDAPQAWELAYEALAVLADSGDRVGAAEALEVVAGLAAERDKPDQTVRLLAAAEQFLVDAGIVRSTLQAEFAARYTAAAQAQLGPADAEEYRREGARLSLDEAVAYARRGRGARGRPQLGWASLTPTERKVIQLVGEGHTNGEIGNRMFLSVHTVKKYLSQVYAKVGVAGRAELVAEAARRDL
jgi:predicted ATPase/DNA-binding CsgD family transcriptional regulator